MGNQQTKSLPPELAEGQAHAQAHAHAQAASGRRSHDQPHATTAPSHAHIPSQVTQQLYPSARRRESIQALTGKSLVPPSPSLTHVESTRPQSRGHSRRRSQTTTAIVADQLRDSLKTASQDKMGNEQSSQKGHHKDHHKDKARAFTPPVASSTPEKRPSPPQEPPAAQQTSLPPPPQPIQPEPSPQTLPIHVPSTVSRDEPQSSRTEDHQALVSSIDPAEASQDYMVSSPHFSRPPRLPLPIEEEDHTPGSPIISAQDLPSPTILDRDEVEGALPRRSSIVSSTTADDDDLGEEFKGPSTGRPTVPTLIEWEGPGERVYVTGTFTGWNRKYRLNRG